MTVARQLGIVVLVCALGMVLTGCPPDHPACRNDEDCHRVNPDEFCVNGQCGQCRDDTHCVRGQQCDSGTCVRIPGWCESRADCPPGQICVENFCRPCETDDQCGDGEICEAGSCVAGCREDADCPAGQVCIENQCQFEPTEPVAQQCGFDAVYFDFDSSAIRSEMRPVLEGNANCVRERESTPALTLEGNCDPRGTTEYNYALGEQRARAVKRVLVGHGVNRNSVRTVSYGEDRATGTNESSWANDRRVDVAE